MAKSERNDHNLPSIIFNYSQGFGFRSLKTVVCDFEMAITVHFTTVIDIFWIDCLGFEWGHFVFLKQKKMLGRHAGMCI